MNKRINISVSQAIGIALAGGLVVGVGAVLALQPAPAPAPRAATIVTPSVVPAKLKQATATASGKDCGAHTASGKDCGASASAPSPVVQNTAANNALPPALANVLALNSQRPPTAQTHIIKTFKTGAGLTGYVLNAGGHYTIAYGRGQYAFIGALIGPHGNNLTAGYQAQYVPHPSMDKIADALQQRGHLVTEGAKHAPVIYVFADPNCIFCHKFYEELRPYVAAGKIRVHWALVGFLKPSSMGKATAILTAKDPVAALAYNEAHFNDPAEEGGTKPQTKPDPQMAAIAQANLKSMAAAGEQGTPGVLYKAGGHWRSYDGEPSPAILAQMLAGKAVGQ